MTDDMSLRGRLARLRRDVETDRRSGRFVVYGGDTGTMIADKLDGMLTLQLRAIELLMDTLDANQSR